MSEQTALVPAPEKLDEQQIYDFLNGAGNHELKLLTTAVILSNPDFTYTATSLSRTVLQRQGQIPEWNFQSGIPQQYCEQSLEPIGAVVISKVMGERGKEVTGYRANPDHRRQKLAMTGFLLDWSLRHPDLSLLHVYGTTASQSAIRSPQVRHQIYLSLLTGDDGEDITGLYESLEGAGYKYRVSINAQLDAMQEHKLISVVTNKINYDPIVQIDDTEYTHLSRKLAETLPETQALYTAIRRLGKGEVISTNALVSLACSIDDSIDEVKLRTRLLNSFGFNGYPGLRVIDKGALPDGQASIVQFTDTARTPIAELCDGIEAIKDGHAIAENVQKAIRITNDPVSFAALTAKAKEFSPAKAGKEGRSTMESQLTSIVHNIGVTTVAAAKEALFEQYNRRISARMLRSILIGMAKSEKIVAEDYYKDLHSKVAAKRFKPLSN